MTKHKKSGPAIFMYTVICICIILSAICFGLYYSNTLSHPVIFWTGIVAFMIMYHFWARIIMGNISKLIKINIYHPWFKERFFEEKLYDILKVKKWKDKALTYNPEMFSLKNNSLYDIAHTMSKSEVDHWLNQLIALSSILFSLIWGKTWIFVVTAIASMLFDGQFIVIQRYNRPKILRLAEKKKAVRARNAALRESRLNADSANTNK